MTYPEPDTLWPWLPNWSASYRETWEYKTDIITSRSGHEQRRALRATPRKTMEYSASVFGGDSRKLASMLANKQTIETNLIDLPRRAILSAPLTPAQTFSTVQSVPRWLAAGLIVAIRNGSQMEIRKVQSISSNTVYFTYTGQSITMPAGSYLHPAIPSYLKDSITSSTPTNSIRNVALGFEAMPGYYPATIAPSNGGTYRGLEVFKVKPNWATVPQITNDSVIEDIDFGQGRVQRFTPRTYNTQTVRFSFLKQGESSVDSCVGLFERCLGRRNPFFSPTWQNDLPPADTLSAGSTGMLVKGTDGFLDYMDSKTHRSICVALSDSTYLFNTVTDMWVIGQNTFMAMEHAWVHDIDPSKILFISWMPVWRFASDQLTIEWLTDSVAQFQLAFQMLEDTTTGA